MAAGGRAGEVKAVILALHGFNDYSNAFEGPGEAWAERGIATYAYDQRGFGAAPERGLWPGRAALAADAATAAQILRRLYPRVPLYLLGDSMGGAVAVVAMTGESGTPRSRCRRRHPDRAGGVGPRDDGICPGWPCGPGCA